MTEALFFLYKSTSSYLFILTYSFPVSRGEYHFHNYSGWIPARRSHKGTQPVQYNDKLPECIGGGQGLATVYKVNLYALKSLFPFDGLVDPHKLSGLHSSDSGFLPDFLLVLNRILHPRFQRYDRTR